MKESRTLGYNGVLLLDILEGSPDYGESALGGMVSATLLLVVFVPVFYVVIQRLSERFWHPKVKAGDSNEGS